MTSTSPAEPKAGFAPFTPPASQTAGWYVAAILAGVVAALAGAILYRNGGTFTYTLDDPYIHLVLARSISAGHYGFNAGESSSPSSSIAFPFLLVPFVAAGAGTFAPFIINVVSLLLTAVLLHAWLVADLGADRTTAAAITLFIALGFNLVGLVFTGMEHSLQVLFGLLACRGAFRTWSGRGADWTFWLAVVAGPLVRYEMLAVSVVAASLYAWHTGRLARPALALAAALALVFAFGLFLVSRGLWWLPNSVLAKAGYLDAGRYGVRTVWNLFTNLIGNTDTHPGALLVVAALAVVGGALKRPNRAPFAVAAVALLLAELAVGQVGWYRRYEVWALTALSFLALSAWAPLNGLLAGARGAAVSGAVACAVLLTSPYVRVTLQAPQAAGNIYHQHYQMGVLANRLGVRSIAANDIGLVGWLNPGAYVLDLVGLASTEALEHRRCCPDEGGWVEEAAERHRVELAMVYDSWLPVRPQGWTRIAELRLTGKRYSAADSAVAIYGATPRQAAAFEPRVRAFAGDLPAGASLGMSEARDP